ncbi:MAG: outer membrane beta-barrel protein [Salibacteraceae bacterium]
MRKINQPLFILFLSSLWFSAFSQNQKFQVGVDIGISITSMYNKPFIPCNDKSCSTFFRGKNHYTYGLYYRWFVSKYWGLGIDVSMKDKGGGTGGGDVILPFMSLFDGPYSEGFNMRYISIPLMSQFRLGKKNNFFIELGPYAAYLTDVGGPEVLELDAFNRAEFGIDAGLGFNFNISKGFYMQFEAKNSCGLTPIIKSDYVHEYDFSKMKTNTLSIKMSVAYKFGTRSKKVRLQ